MTDRQSSTERIPEALEVADGYLDEAQDVLWETSSVLPDNSKSKKIEKLTEDIWIIQNHLNDLQQEI